MCAGILNLSALDGDTRKRTIKRKEALKMRNPKQENITKLSKQDQALTANKNKRSVEIEKKPIWLALNTNEGLESEIWDEGGSLIGVIKKGP